MQGDLTALIARVEKATGPDNALDIAIDITLFIPDLSYISVHPNAAGTKVVYVHRRGGTDTYWAADHTLDAHSRAKAVALLRALQSQQKNSEVKDAG